MTKTKKLGSLCLSDLVDNRNIKSIPSFIQPNNKKRKLDSDKDSVISQPDDFCRQFTALTKGRKRVVARRINFDGIQKVANKMEPKIIVTATQEYKPSSRSMPLLDFLNEDNNDCLVNTLSLTATPDEVNDSSRCVKKRKIEPSKNQSLKT